MNSIAVCIPTRNDKNESGTLSYPLISLATQTMRDICVYIRDEGNRDAYSDRAFRLVINLLANKGICVNYTRTLERRGAGFARKSIFEMTESEPYILWLDDDMVVEPDAIERLLDLMQAKPKAGFVQGVKTELDPFRKYHNDINMLNHVNDEDTPFQIWFGDTALLLVRREAFTVVDWEVLTRYQIDGLTGEDVSMSLMMAQHYDGWAQPSAKGWHISPAVERWLWEPPSDALQVELLRSKVDKAILKKAMPHMAEFIDRLPEPEKSN